ncbi:MAG: hypothetical protein EBR82_57030 [Caulobacteraceae bacterium]|nr:hypothetical protein [Caulobacteraceae bacterium]
MNVRYIVLRDGIRVSEDMHTDLKEAEVEAEFWRKVIRSWPDGTKVVIKKIGSEKSERKA